MRPLSIVPCALFLACSANAVDENRETPLDSATTHAGGETDAPPAASTTTAPPSPVVTTPDVAAINERKAQMLTSFWENDSTVFQYAFARNNHDGYGYTTGRIGFTTATGDTAEVVVCFDNAFGKAQNPVAKYETVLTNLRNKMLQTGSMQPDISALDAIGDFVGDWKAAANGTATAPAFAKCQDDLVDGEYWKPMVAIATTWGLTTALSHASLYDAVVVHGEDNVKSLAASANADVGNGAQKAAAAPLSRDAESKWLAAFLKHRTALIDSSDAWRGAIARGANYEAWRRAGNFDFATSLVTDATANGVYPGLGYSASGYQACVIAADGAVSGPEQCTARVSN